jgi:N-methylhydantoinase B
VCHRVRNGWVSPEKARAVYGVALDLSGEDYRVDQERTAQLRLELRNR